MEPLTRVMVYSRASFSRVIESTIVFFSFTRVGSFTSPGIDQRLLVSLPKDAFSVCSERQMRRLFTKLPVRRSYLGKCSPSLPSGSGLRQRGMQCLRVLATSPTGSPERSHCRLEPCQSPSPGLCRSASDLERSHMTLFKNFKFQQFIIHKRHAIINVVSIRATSSLFIL